MRDSRSDQAVPETEFPTTSIDCVRQEVIRIMASLIDLDLKHRKVASRDASGISTEQSVKKPQF